eukprot:scaffold93929_cov54-Attheya_sp.AAC.2
MSSDSMLAAMVCFISDRILAVRLSSTNMLCSGANLFPSLSKTPLWILSEIACRDEFCVFGQGCSSTSYGFPICGARVTAKGLSGRDEEEFAYDEGDSCGNVRVMFGVTECSGHVIIEY